MDDLQTPQEQRGIVAPDDYVAVPANVPIIAETREEFIRTLPQKATIAEIGVAQGGFSQRICLCNPKKLYLVDAWDLINVGEDWVSIARKDELICRGFFKAFANVEVIKATSSDASQKFTGESLDWLYLDSDHTEKAVFNDLVMWLSKVKVGGYLMGHDFCFTGTWNYGVVPAVFHFIHTEAVKLVGMTEYTGEEFPSFILQRIQ